MKSNMNVCIVAGTHGDEYGLGDMVQRFVEAELPGSVYMLTGNPRAAQARVRYIDSDLNRAFAGDGTGYEAERAEEISELFVQQGFTHIVDIHTSPTTHSIVPILPNQCVGPEADKIVNAIPSVTSVVELAEGEQPYSLVAAFGQGGIGLECPRYTYRSVARRVGRGVVDFLRGNNLPPIPRDVYVVDGYIPNDVHLPTEPLADFMSIRRKGVHGIERADLAFVADPATYREMGYGHQGMVVHHHEERVI